MTKKGEVINGGSEVFSHAQLGPTEWQERMFTCAKHNVQQEAINLGKGMASIGSLIAIIENLASLAQLPVHVPTFGKFDGIDLEGALKLLDDCIGAFKALRKAVLL